MKRLGYILRVAIMLAVSYSILRLVISINTPGAGLFPDAWNFLDPFRLIATDGPAMAWSIGVHIMLSAGLVVVSYRRSRDAGWAPWTAFLMLLPVVRLFVFTALAVVPSAVHTNALDVPTNAWLDRILPTSRLGNAVAAILIASALVLPLGFLNVRVLEEYGLALFIGLPFLLGAVSAFLYSHHVARSLLQSLGIAFLTVSLTMLAIFVLAMEGLLCLVMAAPIAYGIAFAGALVGHALSRRAPGGVPTMLLMLLLTPALMAFEVVNPAQAPLFPVVTSLIIDAPRQAVWNELVAFSRMDGPDELLFRAGISYPVEARIEGTGVGACRYCQFNTGPFVEPITTWDEPDLLAFDVLEYPPPMTEFSIYARIDAPHVEGYFQSRRGQFRLETLPDGATLLEGTTWYTHDIWPAWYWRIWSDAILHRIHGRVLKHIKSEVERTVAGDTKS